MRIHLVRHGHVHNPRHLVYASLPGFGLSDEGNKQAATLALRLSGMAIARIVSSPLERAIQTATPLASALNLPIIIDHDLSEWRLLDRWAGHSWDSLHESFPTEVEAYLGDPRVLPFAEESLDAMARRCTDAIQRHAVDIGDTVFVFHQDPVEASTRVLTRSTLDGFHLEKPEHGEIRTLVRTATGWQRRAMEETPPPIGVPTP
ncbi:MAG: histidine phosphatase family protein [Actinobacteria bacterium]|nr:histidine phosphatase family protein [Actinomycetota bacterium]